MSLATGWATAAPKLSILKSRLEMGPLTAGDTAEVEFPLANAGTEPLRIEQVITSCGCTTTSYPETLQPGEKGFLKAKLAANVFWNGIVEKHLTVKSNDPDQPSVDLQFTAQIRPLLQFSPSSLVSVNYKRGDVIRQVFTITPGSDVPVEITGVTPGGPGTEARLLPAESGDKPGTARVEVTIRPPDTGGDFTRGVLLQTTHARVGAVPIVINGVAQDGFTVMPSLLYLAGLRTTADTGPPKIVTLSKRIGSFHILSVTSDRPELKAEVRRPTNGEAAEEGDGEISIRYLGGLPQGQAEGKITVTTDDPARPTIEIPYLAMVE